MFLNIYIFSLFSVRVSFCCDVLNCPNLFRMLPCNACLHTKQGDRRLGRLAHLSLCESAEVENRALDGEVGFRGTRRVYTLYNSGCLI